MKWIAYVFECMLYGLNSAFGAGKTDYMHSVGREPNSTDALVGFICFGVIIAIFACCILLARRSRKKHAQPKPSYNGFMKPDNQVRKSEEQLPSNEAQDPKNKE